ncbi:pseudouridine synthase [Megasphaera vaginalis (ex Srinivasan et al. 2021)]|uniref:Pseudouridine synthase n=1 Tax=Megasphaera vaginalis (ex Srinivasan et al. 2021) TaxID=1111454 RepID=U7UCP7_9FIRM|nr:pseudouridine synthase [Megasphaera vaginalis (ex Srinivasan et al. 2021)]ERT56629.1 pseudouridylate synthase [Megasphaera vaginalis (ex Srinivasan et al. 2021)]
MSKRLMRLDKLLGHSGFGTRREVKELCKGGHVRVDGALCRDSAVKVDMAAAVTVDGVPAVYEEFHYFMLHKPAGLLSATADPTAETVLDLFPADLRRLGLFPVGRLDKDTTGLLLITDDGQWAHRIISPKRAVVKTYEAVVSGVIPADIDDRFHSGVVLADGLRCLPARAERKGGETLLISVCEGKYHQVKRMCAAVGLTVERLHRLSVGALVLDESLAPGTFRSLQQEERELPFG